MKLFHGFILLLVGIGQAHALDSDLQTLLHLKQTHYRAMNRYYHSQVLMVEKKDFKLFCKTVNEALPTLDQFYRDDAQLIAELRKQNDEDSTEYAQTLEDNAQSDLFAYVVQNERCNTQNFEPYAEFLQSIRYSEMNADYLGMTHALWLSAHGLGAGHH